MSNKQLAAIVTNIMLGSGCSIKTPRLDKAYPTVAIELTATDLDCDDIVYTNFKVLPPDRHRFDGDRNGIGCEK